MNGRSHHSFDASDAVVILSERKAIRLKGGTKYTPLADGSGWASIPSSDLFWPALFSGNSRSAVGVCRHFDGLRLRRIWMDDSGTAAQTNSRGHREGDVVNHLSGVASDNCGAQNFVGSAFH